MTLNRQLNVEVNINQLSRAASSDEFALHCAALEWGLADPIIIDSEEDVLSRVQWSEDFTPFQHQVRNLMTFCRCLPVSLVADDVGLGKTITAALILAELMKRRRVSRTLILCPNILRDQWLEELSSKVGIEGKTAKGLDLEREFSSDTPVVVTTYESVRDRISRLNPGNFDFLILDEAHKLRNLHGTQQPPIIARALHQALKDRLFKFVLMLTATPIHNRLWDLYSLVDCLTTAKGAPNPLGTPDQFNVRYVADGPDARKLRPGTQAEFRQQLRKYLVRTRREDARLAFPDRHVQMLRVQATAIELRLQQLLATNIRHLNGFQQSSLAVALMSSPQAFDKQLGNMAERDPIVAKMHAAVKALVGNHSTLYSKQVGLLDIVRQLRESRPDDWRLIVFTKRRETQASIGKLLDGEGVGYGFIAGGQSENNSRNIRAFTAETPTINVLVSTDAGAEGINLQACNVLVNYDLPWNPMVVEQRVGRVQRLASRHLHVTVFNLCIANSPEEKIVGRLMEKLQTISQTVGDIEAILESAYTGDTAKSFSEQMLDLVVKSLLGQDTEEATRLAEKSIGEAKELLRKHEGQIDEQLGRLDDLHTSGPSPPDLSRPEPSMQVEEFVRGTAAADGSILEELGNGIYIVNWPNRLGERIMFDEAGWRQQTQDQFFNGVVPKLYLPGKPEFEKLLQRWTRRAAALLHVDEASWESDARLLASDWLTSYPQAQLERCHYTLQGISVEGYAIAKVVASNGVDSYEKLVEVQPLTPDISAALETHISPNACETHLSLDKLHPDFDELVAKHVSTDPDIRAFCQFYLERLEDECEKAGNVVVAMKKLENDFAPIVQSDVVGFEGAAIPLTRLTLEFAINGHSGYTVELSVAPTRNEVLSAPIPETCDETGALVPDTCLTRCSVTGKRVLQHLLVESEVSGRRGLARLAGACEVTGRRMFSDELGKCEISGRCVALDLLSRSPVSGRLALTSSLLRCDFTDSLVLPEEAVRSTISDRLYRKDEEAVSTVSGVKGHRSEFVVCSVTGQQLLSDESGVSDVSGRRARKDLLVASEKNLGRVGLEDECIDCESTGIRLLLDEAARSDASQKLVDEQLLVASDSGNGRALPEELVTCEISGQHLLPSETEVSSVSGTRARKSEFVRCCHTGQLALSSEVEKSAVSGKLLLRSLLVDSEVTGRLGCEALGEVVRCEVSGARLLLDEAGKSAVSGRMVDRRLLKASDASGKLALPEELVKCEQSGKEILPAEREQCVLTGKRVDLRLLGKSDVSGRYALAHLIVRCEATGKNALPEETAVCQESGRRVLSALLTQCAVTGKLAVRSQMLASDISGRWMLRRCAVTTYPYGTMCHPDEAVDCGWSGKTVLRSETFQCHWTGLTCFNAFRGQDSRLEVLERLLSDFAFGDGGAHWAPWLEQQVGGALKGLESVRFVSSPGGSLVACCCGVRRAFQFTPRMAVFLMSTGSGRKIIGHVTVFKERKGLALVERRYSASGERVKLHSGISSRQN